MALRPTTQARILDAAEDLFFSHGVQATPVDAITRAAGVSAATLYRGYASKEALLAAALERRHRAWMETWDHAVARHSTDRTRLLAVFEALEDFWQRPFGARWCAFLGSAAEFSDAPPEVIEAVRLDTTTLRSRLTELAGPLVGEQAGDLAAELLLVITGELAMRLREPDHRSDVARDIAATLIGQRGS